MCPLNYQSYARRQVSCGHVSFEHIMRASVQCGQVGCGQVWCGQVPLHQILKPIMAQHKLLRWYVCDWTLVWPEICLIWVSLLQRCQNVVCPFCSLKIEQVMHDTGAMLNVQEQAGIACRVLNKEHAVWLTGAGPPTSVSWGYIFSHVRPLYERAVNDLDPWRSMHRPV